MDLSKFEKQHFAKLPRAQFFAESRGNKQSDKIARTTQVKRLYHAAMPTKVLSMKAWARAENTPLTQAWLAAK